MGAMKDFDIRIRSGGDDAIAAVSELMPRWIPVSERLPIVQPINAAFAHRDVIVWDGNRVFAACYSAYFDPEDDSWSEPDYGSIKPPICWMPLPEPPAVVA